MNLKNVLPAMIVPVALVATGCMNERAYVDPSSSIEGGRAPSNLELQNGSLAGEFGPRAGFDGPATEMTGTSDREWQTSTTTVTRTENGRGTGMIILWTNGVLLEDLEPGEPLTYAYDPSSLEGPAVSANGCSGANASSIDYDAPADEVTVQVTRTPEGRVYDVSTRTPRIDSMGNTIEGEDQIASAQFTLVGR